MVSRWTVHQEKLEKHVLIGGITSVICKLVSTNIRPNVYMGIHKPRI